MLFDRVYLRDKALYKLNRFSWPPAAFVGLLFVICVLFLMGGSSRNDVQSLAVLNPVMITCSGAALLKLKAEHWRGKKLLAFGMLLMFALVALHFSPIRLGPGISLPGAGETINIRLAAGPSGSFQSSAMAYNVANASFFFLFAPLAVVLFAVQLDQNHIRLTLPILITIGAISGFLGVLQLGGSAYGPLYFYRITNNSTAVGLFANRNHAAVFLGCLFPMLATFAFRLGIAPEGSRSTRQLVAIFLIAALVPLVLVTGSRSGLLTATAGLIGALLIGTSGTPSGARAIQQKYLISLLSAAAIVCLVLITIYFSRAEAVERIFADPGASKDRTAFWASSLALFWQYFPIGFGPGSFAVSFQILEPIALLDGFYLNRLHNDWLETGLAFGIPGIIFMLFGIVYYLHRTFLLWMRMDGERSAVSLGRMASIVIAILGIASVSDYPLRTPAMAGFGALVLVWFLQAGRETRLC